MNTPIIWSIAGTDSGGGAGLAADQRAADALGVHCCTVVAGITAQSTTEVTHIEATPPAVLQAQLDTLAKDMPPRAIKTGLLGSAENVRVLAAFIDRLRAQQPLVLVVDPVLRASTGAALADAELRAAYRELLLPRATAITPNQTEAVALLEERDGGVPDDIPAQARALRALGCEAVVITGGDAALIQRHDRLSLDWLDTAHTNGWLVLPREATPHNHGTGCTFASAMAAALALGWVSADAAVLAKMAATHALRHARSVGRGVGPVIAREGFATDPSLLPQLSLDESLPPAWASRPSGHAPGVYAIVDSAERAEAVLATRPTVDTLQLRMKRPPNLDEAGWHAALREAITRSQRAADAAGVRLVVNDHWRTAIEAGAKAVHLGQEDLLALSPQDRVDLQAARAGGVQLGISSHSLWELCRAAATAPDLIACGPVWPTTTKDMPWLPQGLDNLAWWAHMAPAPVVGIGGILEPEQLQAVASTGVAGACVVRGLGDNPALTLPGWLLAWQTGRQAADRGPPALPHPTLPQERQPST
ncbi:MAG TPA: bifunctional hydroxymethylpyrimidine kinase/phosphomethylpyrimidine kinase [Hydrogenophaga sp.]|uniref:bifunctional hydroxymethylpyrimidine kinase/phosphomethylpyrimidine kinase n=1 Tax=Hydrogenophaga sp. TaxID=1904254 RepID=UPI002C3B2FE1|nr:bifunctional hydroxymethylpyrimidine kinase/phosphomethylpyrimidine kinase [Hydrogenophaga sp.]HMN93837.1 bifunctional hydroxymethylpyrimidine kinase/phosphomethylpyrimidine kinase [Hydrogenophaga sp.]HMP09852.1 bifunctional hydroxymethylpyrimidine kinase/phosphomethylpyrimidine kinase [Hydrogenophaga sp.]